MNRRDIIIVAVLINAGLLVTLFVSSLKRESELPLVMNENKEVEIAQLLPPSKPGSDQVDQVISQYTAMTKKEESEKEAPPAPVLTPKVKEEVSRPAASPVPKPTPKAPSHPPHRVVTVEKGDVLEKIARSHGVSVDEIMKLNDLKNSQLQIGQELKLPGKTQKSQGEKKEDGSKYYVVKGGDNPWTIARKNHMKVEELLRLNNMDEEKAKRLRPGDRLKIKP
ncbi:MAG: LysM peptidoglycan-binding domain-containing protein [Chlamydiia bacterium]|nr:LysM peptidoglycan-binding domain-containing protein [Chlamydiia bacterium]